MVTSMKTNKQQDVLLAKKAWSAPELVCYGDVTSLTKKASTCTDKDFGGSDGLTLAGDPIQFTCAS